VSTEVAPDGSPVEIYRRLPATGEPELIHGAIPAGASILELGCGAGRITHELIRLGHAVTAVDESSEMLANVRGAEIVRAEIETLELGRTFDCVVLASHFVNEVDPERRCRLLEVCARHVAPSGSVLVESYPAGFDWDAAVGKGSVHGDVAITVTEARVDGPLVDAVVEYAVDGRSWRQTFTARMLDEAELVASLADAGLELVRWLDVPNSWCEARPCENRASMIVEPRVEEYAEAHTTSDGELFERLAAETREKTEIPQMMVGKIEGQFLAFLVRATGARRVLELGTFTGYSSIAMARALPDGGRIVTCDVNEETTAIARRYAEEAGVVDRIDYRLGPAMDTIAALEGPFDLVFIDADKVGYIDYYEAALPKLADDGLILVDNTLASGTVVDDDPGSMGEAIKRFNDHVSGDERVESVMLTIRDGVTLIRRRRRA
jgi:caffeoyl-CoA O-methyltransferase